MDGQDSPKILITRLSHIGDCLLTLPMLNQLRKRIPNAKVVWAVESPTQQLLSLHQGIDEIIKIPKSWASKPKNWWNLRRQLQAYKFDIAIDPQGISKSAGLGWLSAAKTRIGIKGRWGRELSPWCNNRLVTTESPHIVDRSIELLSALDDDFQNDCTSNDAIATFDLPLCSTAKNTVDAWLQVAANEYSFDSTQIAMINPGGSWASKRWEMDRLGKVATHLKSNHGLTSLVVWAGDEERAMAQAVADTANANASKTDPACVIASKTSLRELAALAARCQFIIGGDTGPLHLAASVGTPCVGLYGTTRPSESGAYGDQHIHVQAWYQDGSCRQRRSAANDAMRDILVADVNDACDRMIESLHGSVQRLTLANRVA